jgi:heterodisulfide reductase subunit B
MFRDVNAALAEGGLSYGGHTRVRHPLDVLMNDIGAEAIRTHLRRDLRGLRIAPYYGCQIVRPDKGFDDQEDPVLLDRLFRACGARIVDFPMKVRCCGGMLMTTFPDTALRLNRELLQCAVENGAEVVATTCPLCHFNLEGYQQQINRTAGTAFALPVLYFTQLLGIALGLSPESLALDSSFLPLGDRITSLAEAAYA